MAARSAGQPDQDPLYTNATRLGARSSRAWSMEKNDGSPKTQSLAHEALDKPTYVEDKDTGELRRPHHIDLKTGMYRGRQVLEPKDEY